MRIKSQGESGRCSSSGRIKGWDKRGKVEESQEPSQEPSVKIQEQKVKENTDEIGKLPKRDRIGPFGSLFSSQMAGIYLLILVLGSCILTLDSHLLSRY